VKKLPTSQNAFKLLNKTQPTNKIYLSSSTGGSPNNGDKMSMKMSSDTSQQRLQ